MTFRGRVRHAARRVRAAGILAYAVVRLLVGLRRRRPLELWVGDSNALCMNRELHLAPLSVGPEGQVIWHLGPRLMYTTATKGPPAKVHRMARLVRRLGRGNVVLFYSAGEIDVRCHLVERSTDPGFGLDFVGEYVRQVCELGREMRARAVVVVVPTPQSGSIPEYRGFPITGSLEDRVALAGQMRARLAAEVAAVAADPPVLALDATDLLSQPDGSMRQDITLDGVHTNAEGIALIRSRVHALPLP